MGCLRRPQLTPILIKTPDSIKIASIAAGYAHTMLLTTTGQLYGCGYNDRGQLGLGHRINTSKFKVIPTYTAHSQYTHFHPTLSIHPLNTPSHNTPYTTPTNPLIVHHHITHPQTRPYIHLHHTIIKFKYVAFLEGKKVLQVACGQQHTVLLVIPRGNTINLLLPQTSP